MSEEEKSTIETSEETKTSECPKCEECTCAGWKAGFGIFVALCLIMTIVAIVFLIKGNSIKKNLAEKTAAIADNISKNSHGYVMKKDIQKDAVTNFDSETLTPSVNDPESIKLSDLSEDVVKSMTKDQFEASLKSIDPILGKMDELQLASELKKRGNKFIEKVYNIAQMPS